MDQIDQDGINKISSAIEDLQNACAKVAGVSEPGLDIGDRIEVIIYDCACWLSKRGHTEALKRMISTGHGIDLDTIIGLAAMDGNLEIVKSCIKAGSKIDECFRTAASYGVMHIVRYLSSFDVNIDITIKYIVSNDVWRNIKNPDAAEYLVSLGKHTPETSSFAIEWAASKGFVKLVKSLVATGADIPSINRSLVIAVKRKYIRIVKHLISVGADYRGSGLNRLLGVRNLPRCRDQICSALDMMLVNKE